MPSISHLWQTTLNPCYHNMDYVNMITWKCDIPNPTPVRFASFGLHPDRSRFSGNAFFFTELLGVDDLPAGEHVLEEVQSYPWYVDTKYYTADVALCTSGTRTIGNQDFAQSVQATILLFDSKQVSV